jgi:phosphomannomutase
MTYLNCQLLYLWEIQRKYSKFKIIRMTLIKSISGIRGTIGGKVGDLTPLDAVKFASAYGTWLKNQDPSILRDDKLKGSSGDARISGPMIHNLVVNTLIGLGIDVIDLGLSTTPTVEVAVPLEK